MTTTDIEFARVLREAGELPPRPQPSPASFIVAAVIVVVGPWVLIAAAAWAAWRWARGAPCAPCAKPAASIAAPESSWAT